MGNGKHYYRCYMFVLSSSLPLQPLLVATVLLLSSLKDLWQDLFPKLSNKFNCLRFPMLPLYIVCITFL